MKKGIFFPFQLLPLPTLKKKEQRNTKCSLWSQILCTISFNFLPSPQYPCGVDSTDKAPMQKLKAKVSGQGHRRLRVGDMIRTHVKWVLPEKKSLPRPCLPRALHVPQPTQQQTHLSLDQCLGRDVWEGSPGRSGRCCR